MADTRQIVKWSLELRCELRPGGDPWAEGAAQLLARAKAYSAELRAARHASGVFGDIFVSSYTFVGRGKGPRSPYPVDGFIISEEFRGCGGPEGLFAMCGRCPANTTPHELAGCYGHLYQTPHSAETEEQLQRIVGRLGLEAQMHAAFPATTPLWFGLWAVSPVPKPSLGLLHTLVSAMLAEDRADMEAGAKIEHRQLRDFASFIGALDLAQQHDLPLHVSLLPLGHTDFGVYTIFPHCPFCKATANVRRWQRKYPAAHQRCEVCGVLFSPAETASQTPMESDDEGLRDKLGEAQFLQFAREYLLAQGESPASADAIVLAAEAERRAREEKRREALALDALREAYLKAHIFHGLPTVPPPRSMFEDGGTDIEEKEPRRPWFDAKTLLIAIRRATAAGIPVISLTHSSVDEEMDRFEPVKSSDPMLLLKRWVEEGCSEKFQAYLLPPAALVRQAP